MLVNTVRNTTLSLPLLSPQSKLLSLLVFMAHVWVRWREIPPYCNLPFLRPLYGLAVMAALASR